MNVINFLKRRACWVAAWAALVGQATFTNAQTVLIDFGSDTSFRGLSVNNPDTNGNYWNSVQPGLLIPDLIDIDNAATTIDLGWDTPVGTDSFNGPAGVTDEDSLETDVMFTEIDAAALGNLGGSFEGVFDFAAGFNGTEHFPVRFQLQGLNPAATYNLTFFGSHKFSNDSTTVYTVYTDNTYTTPVATTELLVQDPFFEHNQDRLATITGVSPQTDDILYIEFVGETGFGGYLNAMQLEADAPDVDADFDNDNDVDGNDLLLIQRGFGTTTSATDFMNFRSSFGASATANVGAVPEPAAFALAALAMMGLAGRQVRRSENA